MERSGCSLFFLLFLLNLPGQRTRCEEGFEIFLKKIRFGFLDHFAKCQNICFGLIKIRERTKEVLLTHMRKKIIS
jgi:hypothetical protein